jgi:hypothetical protein
MNEHQSALSIIERALVCGVDTSSAADSSGIDAAAVDLALAHVATCDECGRRIDLAETLALIESDDEIPAMTSTPVDAGALFETALAVALSDPDELVRLRAAERLGHRAETGTITRPATETDRLGPAAVGALVAAAGNDGSQRVRAAALTVLQALDPRVSLPPWLIDVWSAAPAEATPYLKDVAARLTGQDHASDDSPVGQID